MEFKQRTIKTNQLYIINSQMNQPDRHLNSIFRGYPDKKKSVPVRACIIMQLFKLKVITIIDRFQCIQVMTDLSKKCPDLSEFLGIIAHFLFFQILRQEILECLNFHGVTAGQLVNVGNLVQRWDRAGKVPGCRQHVWVEMY